MLSSHPTDPPSPPPTNFVQPGTRYSCTPGLTKFRAHLNKLLEYFFVGVDPHRRSVVLDLHVKEKIGNRSKWPGAGRETW